MNRDQMWEWLEELKKTVLEAKGTYHPGEQCTYCRRNHDCAAMTAMARRDVLVLGEPGMADRVTAGFPDLPDRDLIALYRRGKVIARIIDDVTQATRRRVEAAPGRALPDGEGRELRIVETAKRVIDPILAHPVLEERFTPAEIAACTIIRPSRLDNAISEKTERGGKKAAIEELDEALRAAGAVTDEPSERMIDARTKEPGA
jgi:hypothetical protein